jgi:predicted RNA-binding protein YlxR (DUF448 family)
MCCVCRERKDERYFIRIYRTGKAPNFTYAIDETGKSGGRGCHVCPACIEKCVKTRALNRSFKGNVPQSIYDMLTKGMS